MAVFKVDKDFKIIIDQDAVRLVPELAHLEQNELLYIILVVDYMDGPYRRLPLEERRNLARKRIWGSVKYNPEISEKIKIGMSAYKGLVFDIRRETIDIFIRRVKQLQDEILKDLPISKIREYDQSISFLQERIQNMQKELDIDEEKNFVLKGERKMSMIEEWQQRQRRLKEFQDHQ